MSKERYAQEEICLLYNLRERENAPSFSRALVNKIMLRFALSFTQPVEHAAVKCIYIREAACIIHIIKELFSYTPCSKWLISRKMQLLNARIRT